MMKQKRVNDAICKNLSGARIASTQEFTRIVSNAKMLEIPECLQRIIKSIGSALTESGRNQNDAIS